MDTTKLREELNNLAKSICSQMAIHSSDNLDATIDMAAHHPRRASIFGRQAIEVAEAIASYAVAREKLMGVGISIPETANSSDLTMVMALRKSFEVDPFDFFEALHDEVENGGPDLDPILGMYNVVHATSLRDMHNSLCAIEKFNEKMNQEKRS